MARHKKTGLDYFPHDVDLSSDEKIEVLEALHGNDGYAVYNKLLEKIYRQAGELDISDPETRQTLAKKFNVDLDKFDKIVATCLKKNLFDKKIFGTKKILTSKGIKKRCKPVMVKRQKAQDDYKKKLATEKAQKRKESVAETDIVEKRREEKSREENIIIKKLDDLKEIPAWIPEKEFKNWIQMRLSTGIKTTTYSIDLSIDKLKLLKADGQNLTEVLNKAIEGGWSTIHAVNSIVKNKKAGMNLDEISGTQ